MTCIRTNFKNLKSKIWERYTYKGKCRVLSNLIRAGSTCSLFMDGSLHNRNVVFLLVTLLYRSEIYVLKPHYYFVKKNVLYILTLLSNTWKTWTFLNDLLLHFGCRIELSVLNPFMICKIQCLFIYGWYTREKVRYSFLLAAFLYRREI